MSYFHTGIRTIIGAESFHCPVRDGKEWYQLAMVIRLKRFLVGAKAQASQFIESMDQYLDCCRDRESGFMVMNRDSSGQRLYSSCLMEMVDGLNQRIDRSKL